MQITVFTKQQNELFDVTFTGFYKSLQSSSLSIGLSYFKLNFEPFLKKENRL